MPRIRTVAEALDRRTFLTAAGAASAATGLGLALGLGGGEAGAAAPPAAAPVRGRQAPPPALAPYTRNTTLQSVAKPSGTTGYRRLGSGTAWPRLTRTDLAAAKPNRATRRKTLAAFVQFTDLHIVDVQHPLRYEYLRAQTASAWRPQEALSVAGAVSLVERVNALRGAPATGAPLSFVMTTGDNTDNNSKAELDWFLTAMSGGTITPNTGDPRRYEGVQDSGLKLYWHPDDALRDADKRLGFPHLDGFLEAATRQVRSPGLNLPWYSTVGNHDSLPGGCFAPGDAWLTDFATGGKKLMELPEAEGAAFWKSVKKGLDPKGAHFKELIKSQSRKLRPVTPDPARAPFTPAEYLQAHLDPAHAGHGPVGHGYTQANLASTTQYYAFEIAEGVLGVSLDTTDPGGHYEGSLGTAQLKWLERTLKAADKDGAYVVVFSHHTSASMRTCAPIPRTPARSGTAATRSSRSSRGTAPSSPGSTATATRTTSPRTAASGRSPPPRTSTSRSWPASSRSPTTRTARSPCSPRSSSRPPRTERISPISPSPDSARSTGSWPSTRPAPSPRWAATQRTATPSWSCAKAEK